MRITLHMELELIMTLKNEYISRWLEFVVQVKNEGKKKTHLSPKNVWIPVLYSYYKLQLWPAYKKKFMMLTNYEKKFYFFLGNNNKLRRNFEDEIL